MAGSMESNQTRARSRVALVTGAGRGIGAATALALADQGHRVALVSRTLSEVQTVAAEITKRHGAGRAFAMVADVSSVKDVDSVFQEIASLWGPVEVLVNNAGVIARQPFVEMPIETFDLIQAVNVRGPFLCSQRLFKGLQGTGLPGSIVNISSLGGIRSTQKFEGFSAYVASKHAVVGLTESLAVEGKPLGIRVNCVAPGAVATKMLRDAVPFLKTSTNPEDIAEIIVYLSDETRSKSLNGVVIEVNSNE